MKKLREDCIPAHVKVSQTYEEDMKEVSAEGWEPHMVEDIVRGRQGQRIYYHRITYNRNYYQRPTLLARTQARNKRRAEQLAESAPDIQESAKEKHRQAQTRYRASRRALLADKERERRRARQLQTDVGGSQA